MEFLPVRLDPQTPLPWRGGGALTLNRSLIQAQTEPHPISRRFVRQWGPGPELDGALPTRLPFTVQEYHEGPGVLLNGGGRRGGGRGCVGAGISGFLSGVTQPSRDGGVPRGGGASQRVGNSKMGAPAGERFGGVILEFNSIYFSPWWGLDKGGRTMYIIPTPPPRGSCHLTNSVGKGP